MTDGLFTVTLIRNCQLFATVLTTVSQNATTILGCHSLTETVLVHTTAIVGLKCSFHCSLFLFILLIFTQVRGISPHFGLQNYTFLFNYASFMRFFSFSFCFLLTYSYLCTRKISNYLSNRQKNMINSQDIKKGVAVRMDGGIWVCIDFQHRKPGKGNTMMNIKLKNVTDGRVLERRYNIGEKLEDVRIERRPYQYLYKEGDDYVFMNQETFEQAPIAADLVTGVEFMKESDIVEVVNDADTETVLYAEMPVKTVLRVTHSEPGIKGDTATNATKPATLETGVEVRVPLFINEGDLIQVDTRDGSYLQRVKE